MGKLAAAVLVVIGLGACGGTRAVSTWPYKVRGKGPATVVKCHGPPVSCARVPTMPQSNPPVGPGHTYFLAVRCNFVYLGMQLSGVPQAARPQVRREIHHLCRTRR